MSNQCMNEVIGGREVKGNGKRKSGTEFRRDINKVGEGDQRVRYNRYQMGVGGKIWHLPG